jgi:hypothetical protein
MIGLGDRNMPDPRIGDEKPVGKVAFFVHDPNDSVEKGLPLGSGRSDTRRMRKNQRAREELMFVLRECFVPNDQSRCKINDENRRRSSVTKRSSVAASKSTPP